MALKMPVIDIPIDDAQFKRFSELFQQYEERLAKTPGMWQKVNREFRQTTAAILAQNQSMKESMASPEGATRAAGAWRSIAGSARSVLGFTFKITEKLIKWGALLGGGLLGGSLWGLTRMASDMASSRYTYSGLGMRYGGWRSFGINMSRFVDPGSFLSSINAAVSNPALQGPLYSMGVNPNGTTGQVSVDMLKAMRRLAIATPRGELGMMSDAYGLGPFGGLEALLRLRSYSNSQFARYLADQQRDQRDLAIPQNIADKWTEFTAQMERARSSIFKTFVVGLAPLEGPLSRLSGSVVRLVERIMQKNGPLERGIDHLATWIDKFNGKISTPKFLTDVDNFMNSVTALANWALGLATKVGAAGHVIAHPIEDVKVAGGFYGDVAASWARAAGSGLASAAHLGIFYNNPGNLKYAGQKGAMRGLGGFAIFPNPQAGVKALADQLRLDSRRGKNTVSDIITSYAPPSENNTAAYIADVAQRMHVSSGARLNLNDPVTLASFMNAVMRHEQGNAYLPYRVSGRRAPGVVASSDPTIVVTARHRTGASAVNASAALAGTSR